MYRTIQKSVSINLTRFSLCRTCCSSMVLGTLPNGIKIATEVTRSQLACVTLAVASGPRYETSCTNGLTHFIEHILYKGCKSYTKCQLEQAVVDLDGRLSARTSKEEQVFSVVLPSVNALKAADILCKVLTELNITDTKIKEERYNICRELADTDIDPKQVLFEYLNATAFQGTPLGQRVIGSTENLQRFNADVTANFLYENYVPYRLCLATAGSVDPKLIADVASRSIGNIPPVPVGELGPNRYTGSQVVYRDDSMPFCHVAIAFEAPGYTGADYNKMVVLNYTQGAWDRSQGRGEGQASPVARWVAIDKLCERYEPFYVTYRDVGLWGVYFIADKWKLDEIVTRIQDLWMGMCTVLRATDVQRGINLACLNLARQYGSVVWSAHDLAQKVLHTSTRRTLRTMRACASNVTASELRAVADRYLYDRCPVVAVVGPCEALSDYVRIRSGMWWLRY